MRVLLIILSDAGRQAWAESLAASAGVTPHIFVGSPLQASEFLLQQKLSPSHIVLDIGGGSINTLGDIDALAQHCEPGTRVVAVGDTNDVHLYRGLIARGIADYMPMPADPMDVVKALTAAAAVKSAATAHGDKRVISFLSAASGDGASTAAINTAYSLSQLFQGTTVLVDMDYQFGMVAKHLNLQNQYGIRDLFDNPERGTDVTLIKRMVASYGKLHVITAPAELRYLPVVSADAIRELLNTLKLSYDNIILDLPHVWLPWVAAACQQSTQIVMVSQLWLKSVSHSARMMRVFRDLAIPQERIVPVINRSGAKFKEAIEPKDFERVCGAAIRYTLANDIKTIAAAEGSAKTVMEVEASELSQDITRLAYGLIGREAPENAARKSGGLFSRLKKD